MTDYRTRLVEVVHGKPLSRVYCLSDATLIADLRSLLSEADAQAVELERMREALSRITAIENEDFGDDWDEINRAREIARQALSVKAE